MRNALSNLLDRVILGNSPTRRLWFARRMPDGYIRSTQKNDFRTTVRWVASRSSFYRRRFAELHIDPAMVRCPADLGDLFTTSRDLLTNPIEDFLCDRPQAGFETTGTLSPKTKKIYFSLEEMRDMGRDGAAGLWSLGVRLQDRMVSALDLSFWNAGPALRAAAQSLGCLLIEAGKIPPAEFYERAADYRFNVMVVEPSWIVSLTEIAEKQGAWPVKLMLVGGENMSEKSRRYVEEIWKTRLYLTYGQTESCGSAGTECLRTNGYHLQELKFWFEIPEPDEQGNGELVFTTLSRRVMPLLRYRTSDVTRFMEGSCDCDLKALRRISKIRGRCDEMVNCGLGNISPWIFEKIFEGVAGIGHDWQVIVTRPGLRDGIEVRVELLEGASRSSVEQSVQGSLLEKFPDLARNLSMGLCEMKIVVNPRGTLRTGRKLRSIVDLRKALFGAEASVPTGVPA
ncbi:MAG TPA: AMP-binding protein [Candidatus Polarisedimenticolia bacterium]|nr:AMP-binding protein [Candidatus Polarisedimenticolia bacterium]